MSRSCSRATHAWRSRSLEPALEGSGAAAAPRPRPPDPSHSSTAAASSEDPRGHRRAYGRARRLARAGEGRGPRRTYPGSALTGRLTETDPSWLPRIEGASERLEPLDRRRILHITKSSVPERWSGFTIRTLQNMRAQRGAGLKPILVTEIGWPRLAGVTDVAPVVVHDGFEHHRLDGGPDYDLAGTPNDVRLQDTAEAMAAIVRAVRPSILHAHSGYRGGDQALVALALRERFGIPVVYEVRGLSRPSGRRFRSWPNGASCTPAGSPRRPGSCTRRRGHRDLGRARARVVVARDPARQDHDRAQWHRHRGTRETRPRSCAPGVAGVRGSLRRRLPRQPRPLAGRDRHPDRRGGRVAGAGSPSTSPSSSSATGRDASVRGLRGPSPARRSDPLHRTRAARVRRPVLRPDGLVREPSPGRTRLPIHHPDQALRGDGHRVPVLASDLPALREIVDAPRRGLVARPGDASDRRPRSHGWRTTRRCGSGLAGRPGVGPCRAHLGVQWRTLSGRLRGDHRAHRCGQRPATPRDPISRMRFPGSARPDGGSTAVRPSCGANGSGRCRGQGGASRAGRVRRSRSRTS